MDLDDRRHLVVAGGLCFGVHVKPDPLDHLLDIGTIYDSVGELTESSFTVQKKNRHAKFHAELGLQSVFRLMADESVRQVAVGSHFQLLDVCSLDVFGADQAKHFGHPRMSERSRRKRLDRDTRRGERPRLTQFIFNGSGIIGSTVSMEKTPGRFQDLIRSAPA